MLTRSPSDLRRCVVWGERFAPPEPEQTGRPPTLEPRVRAIVAYLETIQQKH